MKVSTDGGNVFESNLVLSTNKDIKFVLDCDTGFVFITSQDQEVASGYEVISIGEVMQHIMSGAYVTFCPSIVTDALIEG
ncbi:hypothetical protein ACPV36_19595 [Photobacterium damselae]|uniref:hypothetical protein n=1 Tax=Photobacterium damselae TaxID=38293 RepID=UPI004068AAEC